MLLCSRPEDPSGNSTAHFALLIHEAHLKGRFCGDTRRSLSSGLVCSCLQEFTLNTQMDLERQMAGTLSRALIAEEQLQSLQHYIAQSTLAYQKEIMRLRSLLSGTNQAAGVVGPELASSAETRPPMHRSGSAGDAFHRSTSGNKGRPELRPIRSASNRQGRLPRPMNERPAVDAWHAL